MEEKVIFFLLYKPTIVIAIRWNICYVIPPFRTAPEGDQISKRIQPKKDVCNMPE